MRTNGTLYRSHSEGRDLRIHIDDNVILQTVLNFKFPSLTSNPSVTYLVVRSMLPTILIKTQLRPSDV